MDHLRYMQCVYCFEKHILCLQSPYSWYNHRAIIAVKIPWNVYNQKQTPCLNINLFLDNRNKWPHPQSTYLFFQKHWKHCTVNVLIAQRIAYIYTLSLLLIRKSHITLEMFNEFCIAVSITCKIHYVIYR